MTQKIDIGKTATAVHWDHKEKCLFIDSLDFLKEPDGKLYFPIGLRTLPSSTSEGLKEFASAYAQLKSKALIAIGEMAHQGGFWGKQLSQKPQMYLVRASFKSISDLATLTVTLAFNDSEHDVYTIWVTEFEQGELKSVERKDWQSLGH